MSCQNGVAPLSLPIINNTISADGNTVSRGIEFGIGTPQQILSVSVSLTDSDTYIYNRAQCNVSAEIICIGRLGGMYDPESSDSYVQTTRAQWYVCYPAQSKGDLTDSSDLGTVQRTRTCSHQTTSSFKSTSSTAPTLAVMAFLSS